MPMPVFGVLPFKMLDLSEDVIADMAIAASYLLAPSSIAPADVKSKNLKLLANVLECSTK